MPVKVVTYNSPHRLRPHKAYMQTIADQGADIITAQEHTDSDNWSPRGWKRYRPKKAQSNTIYWNPNTVKATKKRGALRLSTPGFRSLRYGVWMHFKTKEGPMRVMSVHLPAFASSQASSLREFNKQTPKLAKWIRGGKYRVVAGDFNAQTGNKRMKPVDAVTRFSAKVKSGPSGQPIDYVGVAKHGPFKITRTRLLGKGRSDHKAVMVTIEKR